MTTPPQKPIPPNVPLDLGEPYCGACGHHLAGLVDSSKCPECGRPIVEVVTRAGKLGRRYRSEATLFGLPLIHVALGATHSETRGTARGIFAIGDYAKGWIDKDPGWVQGERLIWHNGSNTMWYAVAVLAPDRDRAYVVASNGSMSSQNAVHEVVQKLADRFAPPD